MNVKKVKTMKTLSFILLLTLLTLCSCSKHITRFNKYTPIYQSLNTLMDSVAIIPKQPMKETGKIYVYKQYLFVSEPYQGVHIFNNTDPKHPILLHFLKIPGNIDIAIKNDTLFADLYTALIKITLTDIKLSKIKKSFIHKAVFDYPHHRMRQLQMKGKDPENGLENHYEPIDETHGIAVGWKKDGILEQEQHAMPFSVYSNMQPRMLAASAVGQGGSLARFAIIDEFLYALNSRELILFKLNANAKIWSRTHLSWGGIETIFTIQNRLFIGSETGMFTYDISNKGNPKFLSQVQHFRSCDPVVANEKFAYVTLRGGTRCFGNTNELQIIDLMQIDSPKVVSRFALAEPYGLALNNNTLFVCDGESGLKIFDVTDKKKPSIIHYLHDLTPLDIILLGNTAIVVAKEGMFQYDITNTTDLVLLSHIPIH